MLESFNPADGSRLGAVPTVPPERVRALAGEVAGVQPYWAQLPLSDRARYLRRTAQVVIDNLDGLATLLTDEQGRPRTESYALELVPSIDALRFMADAGPRVLGPARAPLPPYLWPGRARRLLEPLGVVGVVAAASEPWAEPLAATALALVCGNGVVLHPAPGAPLVGERIAWAFERAGVPEGLVRTAHGEGVDEALSAAADRLLHAGAKGPRGTMLVLADADVGRAVAGGLWGAFSNGGQSASGAGCAFVVPEVAGRFADGVVRGARRLRSGDAQRWTTEIGPPPAGRELERMAELVDEAVAAGATLRCGGREGSGWRPAVVTEVSADTALGRGEALGPVLAIVAAGSEEEAIRLAAGVGPRSAASVWTLDRGRGERIARRLGAGNVWVNDHLPPGLAHYRAPAAFEHCTRPKVVGWDPARGRDAWWHPYDESLGSALHASAQLLWGRDDDKPGALRRGALPILRVARRSVGVALRR